MADVMDRLKKLLAMAQSPVEEEARTAALMAVRLIHEHKIELHMPGKAPPTPSPSTAWVDDLFKTPPPPKPPPQKPPTTGSRIPRYGADPVSLVSRYRGTCKQCGNIYLGGDTIWWMKGKGSTHYNCQSYWYK